MTTSLLDHIDIQKDTTCKQIPNICQYEYFYIIPNKCKVKVTILP